MANPTTIFKGYFGRRRSVQCPLSIGHNAQPWKASPAKLAAYGFSGIAGCPFSTLLKIWKTACAEIQEIDSAAREAPLTAQARY
jgi:hypothetical protein